MLYSFWVCLLRSYAFFTTSTPFAVQSDKVWYNYGPFSHWFIIWVRWVYVLVFFFFCFSLCPPSSSDIWLSDLEAESSEGGGETTPSSSLLPDSETGSGTLAHPVCLALPFLGGMMITRMQDGYDVCHNCCGVRLHSLKRRTRMRTGRNVLGFYSRQVRKWLQLRSERTRNEMRTYSERVWLALNEMIELQTS